MCDPISVIAGANLAVQAGSAIVNHRAQAQQSRAVSAAADKSAIQQIGQVNLREVQEKTATAQSISQADRQARIADAEARVSAGEGGVSGASVDALLGDIQRKDLEYRTTANENLNMTLDQLEQEKLGIRAQAQNIKAGTPFPSSLATGLQIAGAGLNYGSLLIQRRTAANTPGK